MTAQNNNSVPNRLINEKSPYLTQHAANPVNWYPWGEEAFERAKREDKPIFLSIGYSTCHWCHVMERETFRDNRVAQILNENFVSIKVDREERPDVDSVYMSVCIALTGAGGWPLTIFMSPERKPFFAGTYYSRDNMEALASRIDFMWTNSRRELIESSEAITRHINSERAGETDKARRVKIDNNVMSRAVGLFAESFDETHGGFGVAPKFPSPHNLIFLLEYGRTHDSSDAAEMAMLTLEKMYRGGIFDHIAGGFSRYATDEKWLVPHFEKMLYDNALLAQAYLTAYELHGESFCKTAAQKVFSWAFAELMYTETVGGVEFSAFYSGQDADSDGIEGGYYLFERAELDAVLGEESAKRYAKHFGVTKKGNAPGIADGKALNILNLSKNAKFASRDSFIDECSHKLYSYRRRRAAISTDTKILTSQNALMLIALVKAYEVLGDPSYLNAARAVERFITTKLSFGGRLCVRWCADSATGGIGEVFGNGKLDDYANFALALMQLYEITGEREFLDKAAHYGEIMRSRFADNTLGGFFLYADDDEQLISRPKEIFDGATPSGNSTAFMVLALLSKHRSPCDEPHWRELFAQQTNFLADYAANYPMGCAFTLTTALEFVV